MERIALVVLVLVALNSMFQLSQWNKNIGWVLAVVLAVIAYSTYPWIIEQNKSQLTLWFDDPEKMQHAAVLLLIETFVFVLADLSLLKKFLGQPINKAMAYVRYFPGVAIIVAVLYAQMQCFYTFSTVDFDALGRYFAIGVACTFVVCPMVIRWLIPERILRLEMRYLLNFGLLLGSIIISVLCKGLTYPKMTTSFEWFPFFIATAIILGTVLLGWVGSVIIKQIKFKWKY